MPPSFGRDLWVQHGPIRNACHTTSTGCMTWSPQDFADRIEGQDLEEKTQLFLGMDDGSSVHFWNTHIYSYTSFTSVTDCPTGSLQDLVGRIEHQNLQERKDEALASSS